MSRLAWNSALITCLNGLTLVAGLVLYPLIVRQFDAAATDSFFLALTIPWLIIGPVMNAVSSTLIPVLTECRLRRPETVGPLVGSAITNGVVLSVVGALLLGLLAPAGLRLAGSTLPADAIDRVTTNTFLLLPLVVLQTVTSVLDTASNAARCFWLPASATLLQQVATLGAIVALQGSLGDHALAIGFSAGAAAHLAMLWAFWRYANTSVQLGWQLPRELRTAFRLAVPLIVSTGALQIGVLLSRVVAAGLGPGSVTAIDYAYRVTTAVVEVSSSGVLLVILADWSATVVNGNPAELRTKLRNVMPMVLFVLLPMVFVLHALRLPVVTVWLGTAGVAPEFIALTAAILGFLLIGVPLDIAARVYVRAFLVWQETRVLVVLSVARLVTSVVLFFVLTPYLGVPGIALADVIGIVLTLGGLAIAARRHLAGPVTGMTGTMARLAAAAGGGWISARALVTLMETVTPIALIVLVGTISLVIYMLLTWLLRLDELRLVRTMAFAWRAGRVQP